MLAYVFWHRPAADADTARYEAGLADLHASLGARPPVGFHGSASLRAGELPWLDGAGYEDWYVVEDWTALGILREAAPRRPSHDPLGQLGGRGAGGVYRLCEGHAVPSWARQAVWVDPPAGGHEESDAVALLLADGTEAETSGLWRRELVLGPAPQYCLLTGGDAPGVRAGRLPAGWVAQASRREALSHI